jgi:hypothetical protein
MADVQQKEQSHWSLDKRIPIALIVTVVIQSVLGFIWVGGIAETVSQHNRTIEDFRANGTPGVREKLSRLEERTNGLGQRLDRIESGIDRLNTKLDVALEPRRK